MPSQPVWLYQDGGWGVWRSTRVEYTEDQRIQFTFANKVKHMEDKRSQFTFVNKVET